MADDTSLLRSFVNAGIAAGSAADLTSKMLTPAAAAAAQAAFSGGTPVANSRPYLVSFGDSITSQDRPFLYSAGAVNGVSPMGWLNALTNCAFDTLGPVSVTYTPDGTTQNTGGQFFENGVMGYTGGLITQFMTANIDRFLGYVATYVPSGRTVYVMLGGGMNDFNNNDIATYDATAFAAQYIIIQKILAAGYIPILKCGEQSSNLNTANKLRASASYRDRIRNLGVQQNLPVMDIRAAMLKYGYGIPYERMTRGATGDETHPNTTGAVIYGLAGQAALAGRVPFIPPYERADFAGTVASVGADMAGTAGTKGTNANAGAVVPTGQTLNSFDAGIVPITSKGNYGAGPGVFLDAGGTTTTSQRFGLDGAFLNPNTTDTYRGFVDFNVLQADYVVSNIGGQIRHDSAGNTYGLMHASSTDARAMTADQPNFCKLLEGQRLVMSTFPFNFVTGSAGAMYSCGGSGGFTAATATARLRTFTRFAGLVRQ